MTQERSYKLISTLESINKRYCSIFFSKLVLLDQQASLHESNIRHYDMECEAAENIYSVLETKVRSVQLRALYNIKSYIEQKMKPRKPNRNYAKSNADNINGSFSKLANSRYAFSMFYPDASSYRQMHLKPKDRNRRLELSDNPELEEIDYSISKLIYRVKNLSQKFPRKKEEQPITKQERDKMNKRRLILYKLNQLENDLTTYLKTQVLRQNQEFQQPVPKNEARNFGTPQQKGYLRNLASHCYSNNLNMTTDTKQNTLSYRDIGSRVSYDLHSPRFKNLQINKNLKNENQIFKKYSKVSCYTTDEKKFIIKS